MWPLSCSVLFCFGMRRTYRDKSVRDNEDDGVTVSSNK